MKQLFHRGIAAGLVVAALILGTGTYPMLVSMAQQAAPEPAGAVYLQPFIEVVLPYFATGVLALMGGLATLVTKWVKDKWNIDMENSLKALEAKHRDALHSAITTGVADWIARNPSVQNAQINVGSEALATVLRHARNSVPDAFDFFKPGENVIANIATRKAVELTRGLGIALPIPLEGFADQTIRNAAGDRLVGRETPGRS